MSISISTSASARLLHLACQRFLVLLAVLAMPTAIWPFHIVDMTFDGTTSFWPINQT